MDNEQLDLTLVDAGLRWPALKEARDIKIEFEVKRQFAIRTAATLVGIEVEIEGFQGEEDPESIDGVWYTKEDGSLRDSGIEWVSFPLAGMKIPQALKLLFANLRKGYRFSERTGIHFHINYRTKKVKDVLNTGLLYLPFERLLYKLAGEDRYQNIFCTPMQETQAPDLLADFLQNGQVRQFVNQWDKYSGMNFLPLLGFGSIEFRHMRGTNSIPDLIDFLNAILCIRKYASDHTFEHIWSELQPLNNTSQYEWFLHKVMGDFARPFYRIPGIRFAKEMEDGIAAAKMINPPSTFCTKLIEGITKDSDLIRTLKVHEKKPVEPKKYMWEPGLDWRNNVVRGNVPFRDVEADAVEQRIADLAARIAPGGIEDEDDDPGLDNPANRDDGDRW